MVAGATGASAPGLFYIAWDEPGMRPGLLSAPHAVDVHGYSRIEVACSADEFEGGSPTTSRCMQWAAAAGCAPS